jgi:hypothetical protein
MARSKSNVMFSVPASVVCIPRDTGWGFLHMSSVHGDGRSRQQNMERLLAIHVQLNWLNINFGNSIIIQAAGMYFVDLSCMDVLGLTPRVDRVTLGERGEPEAEAEAGGSISCMHSTIRRGPRQPIPTHPPSALGHSRRQLTSPSPEPSLPFPVVDFHLHLHLHLPL